MSMNTKKRTTTKKQTPASKFVASPETSHPMIPMSTLATMMGESRFKRMMQGIKRQFGVDKIFIQHTKPPTLRLLWVQGDPLGTVAEVEEKAKKWRKK